VTTTSELDVRARLVESAKESGAGGPIGLLDVAALADRLGVGERLIRRLVDQRRIPFHKIGKYVRFDPEDVSQWVDRCKVDAVR
jgi:excisionase family DNA binding protein